MQLTLPRLRTFALAVSLLLALPSCEALDLMIENQGVTEDGQMHQQGLDLKWRDLDVWTDGFTVQYKGKMQVATDSPTAAYSIVLQIGTWSHCVLSGTGASEMQTVEGAVQLPDPAVLPTRMESVTLSGQLDTPAGASPAFQVGIGILRRTDPMPTTP